MFAGAYTTQMYRDLADAIACRRCRFARVVRNCYHPGACTAIHPALFGTDISCQTWNYFNNFPKFVDDVIRFKTPIDDSFLQRQHTTKGVRGYSVHS